jgi:hypothetical protein
LAVRSKDWRFERSLLVNRWAEESRASRPTNPKPEQDFA